MRTSEPSRFRRFVKELWDEFAVTRQLSTGDGESYVANWRVPGGFITIELGFGHDHGPSILWWMNEKPRHNAWVQKFLESQERAAQKAAAKKRKPYMRKLRSIALQPVEKTWVPMDPNGVNRREEAIERQLEAQLAENPVDEVAQRRLTKHKAQRMLRAFGRRAGVEVKGGAVEAVR